MMSRAKRIYILMIKVKNGLPSFSVAVFSKRNGKHVLRVSIELQKHRESLGELKKAVETLAYGSYPQSISRSPKHPLLFL